MRKWHQCYIDLKKNVLIMSTTGSQTIFLSESYQSVPSWHMGPGKRPEETADQEALQKSVEDAQC